MRNLPLPARLLALAALLVLLPLSPPLAAQQAGIALVGGTLIDGTGKAPVRNSVILIKGDRIEQVGTLGRVAIPADYERVSAEGMTVLPGLWDPHVHLLYNGHPDFNHWFSTYAGRFGSDTIPASARQFLLAGVTSVRDLAAPATDILSVRRDIRNGEIAGADIYAAGPAIVPAAMATRPHLLGVDGPKDAARKTQALIDMGVDLIKFMGATPATQADFQAVMDTAHAAGLRVTAHGRTDEEIRVGLAVGVDEFQHIGTLSERYPEDILEAIRARIAQGRPLYWSPTIGVDLNADELAADPEFLDDPRNFVGVPADIERDVRQAVANAEFRGRSPAVIETVKRKVQQLNELGVIFVSGSDMGTFGHPAGEATWRDLEAWVFEIGLDPLAAIKWATLDAAAYMGVDGEVGSITPGKRADVIAVRGNPLRHFSVLREPVLVLKNGARVK